MQQQKELAENLSIDTTETKTKIKENQIIVGDKPFMNYVRSAEILLKSKNLQKITIRARGLNIVKAIDLSEAVRNKFCADLKLNMGITTSTEKFLRTGSDKEFFVSIIEITLKR